MMPMSSRFLRAIPALLAALCFPAGSASAQLAQRRGDDSIPAGVENIYRKGLDYLARTQNAKGCWNDSYGDNPGVVGLCITAFLAHGEDPGNGRYATVIRKGLDFILSCQNKKNGYIGDSMYNHGFATKALAEAYGVVDDPRIAGALRQAVDLIISSQKRNPTGGWRYTPDDKSSDTTVAGCQMVTLYAARNAGVPIPDEVFRKGLAYLKRNRSKDGTYGYTSPGGGSVTLTAIGTLCHDLAKERGGAEQKLGIEFLKKNERYRERSYPYYFEYYMSQALFHGDEAAWRDWNALNVRYLGAIQGPDGSFPGNFGNSFNTAGALLSLALNYRFLPIYEK